MLPCSRCSKAGTRSCGAALTIQHRRARHDGGRVDGQALPGSRSAAGGVGGQRAKCFRSVIFRNE
ncbi:hypothetical protein RR42_s3327 [Cupriavidus basilensis]|uniref:Uncharacterized protein n=1 Tax=Cupriavidus basilensis TaxID=68895 RepID=A0A0C4YPD6_9BURK|nr:hypothetical protein RR42_s3327 [Cupriavidus basilensis]